MELSEERDPQSCMAQNGVEARVEGRKSAWPITGIKTRVEGRKNGGAESKRKNK